jgi:DNA-directed RNA polymerase specialized sigma subunit
VEKYASAGIVVIQVQREMRDPLDSIRTRIRHLSHAAGGDMAVAAIAADLDRSWREIQRALGKLADVQLPDELETGESK